MLGRVMAVDYALSTLAEGGAIIAGGMLLDNAELSPKYVSFIMAMIAFVILTIWTVYFYIVRL